MKTKLTDQIGRWLAGVCLLTLPMTLHANTNSFADALNTTGITWLSFGTNQSLPWYPQDAVTHDGDAAAQTGTTFGGQTTFLNATVIGPGTLTFWWKVSSQTNHDFLKFFYDVSANPLNISGEQDWTQKTVTIPSGSHVLHWRYQKDATINAGSDAGWLDEVTFSGTAPQISIQPLNQTVPVGSNATFFAVTLSDAKPVYYQWLQNGTNISGATNQTLLLSSVGRKDRGAYAVQAANSSGNSAVSNATLHVLIPQTLIGMQSLPNGSLQMTFSDGDNLPLSSGDLSRFSGQASTNLSSWITLPGALVISSGQFILTDTNATKYPARYYRIQEQY